MWYWWKNGQIHQCNKKTTKKYTHINTVSWSLTKKQRQHNGVKTVSSTNGARNGYPQAKKLNLDANLILSSQSYLAINHKPERKMQNNEVPSRIREGTPDDVYLVRWWFLDTTPKARSMKEIVDRSAFNTIKHFCSAKDSVKRMRR